ncbi:MAG TPA: type II secretion system F family protein [Peptococcaceae bacterium]|nr:type II secretion system F family protein [Peptococcaceae bacterium]
MQFSYKVIDEHYNLQIGVLEAVDQEAAKKIILDNKWQLIELKKSGKIFNWMNKAIETKLSYETIAAFCTQMGMLIRTGTNLVKGLEILRVQTKDKKLKKVIASLITEVSKGSSLSAAMQACGASLPLLLINLVKVGEESGQLDSVLINMAQYYERENFIRKKIASASIYPLLLTVVMIGLIVFFLNFILPEISGLITETGGELPFLTKIMLGSAAFLSSRGLFLVLGFVALGGLYWRLQGIPKYRLIIDATKLKIPLVSKTLKNVITARFCRTMALFLKASIPIIPILDNLEKVLGNEVSRQALLRAKEQIIKGKGLASAFREEKFFDEMVIQMMTIGEETGQLDNLMEEIGEYYDKQVEIGISRMVALVEPAFTIIIGIFVGLMVISVALPLFTLSENL